ncbi:MAG: acyl carrier protein [Peptococcaceae bacterium]|nr:acyl carrier protein [Peptococcaceae bacterium]
MTFDELLAILEDLHSEIDFRTATALIDDKILDSFDIVTIITEINSDYGITIPAGEIVPENFNSAQALYRLVQRLDDDI